MLTINPADLDVLESALCQLPNVRLADALAIIAKVKGFEASPALVEEARDTWLKTYRGGFDESDLEIDDRASTSPGDGGTWVSAWLWIAAPADEDEED